MINQKKENGTYITGVFEKEEEEKSLQNSLKNSPYKNYKRNSEIMQHSEQKRRKNIISIVFPIIRPHSKKLPDIFSTSQKYLKINKEINNDEKVYKSQKSISIAISKLRSKSKYIDNRNINSKNNSNNSFDNDSKNNSLTNNNYCITSINDQNKPYINQIECNLNLDNNYKKLNNNSSNKYNTLLNKSSISKTQILKQKLFNKENGQFIFNEFLKKELKMEERMRLFPYFLERYSPKLLRRKNTKNKMINDNKIHDKNDEYKIRTVTFKNQTIPYVEKIDVRKISSVLPPISIGSLYNLPDKSEDSLKKEIFYNEIEKFEKELKKGKSIKNKKMTKFDILKMIKNRKLSNCKQLINKTKKNITDTKNKINKVYNKLKISLNEYDDWNSPENADNLYDV